LILDESPAAADEKHAAAGNYSFNREPTATAKANDYKSQISNLKSQI
jgi:hypothetical protein